MLDSCCSIFYDQLWAPLSQAGRERYIMENDTKKNPETSTTKRYLILGRPAGQLLPCMLLTFYYLYCILFPLFYSLSTHFPAEEDIHYTEGLFTYRKSGKAQRKSYQVGVRIGGNTEFFSCTSDFIGVNLCEVDRKYINEVFYDSKSINKNKTPLATLYSQWQGKPAKIGWFKQSYNIFYTKRRVIQIIIDGKEVISKKSVADSINWKKNTWVIDVLMSSPLLIITFLYVRHTISNKDIKNEK